MMESYSQSGSPTPPPKVAVVIPCYRVVPVILDVLRGIGPEAHNIYCVDDACPDGSGRFIEEHCQDARLKLLRHQENQGVGGASVTGFRSALHDGADIVVKIDGDGQMDPSLLPRFLKPILAGRADYCKGNRFFSLESVQSMPSLRLLGNALLSFVTKLSSGYWNTFDPTNGFIAVHSRVLAEIPLEKIHPRYFFESDMLFRLNTMGAVVEDVPMMAKYSGELSNLRISRVWFSFLINHFLNFAKRIVYNHFLRNFSAASVELMLGLVCLLFGIVFGAIRWWSSIQSGVPVTAGGGMFGAVAVVLWHPPLFFFL